MNSIDEKTEFNPLFGVGSRVNADGSREERPGSQGALYTKTLPDGTEISLMRMMTNYRIVLSLPRDLPDCWTRAWCYDAATSYIEVIIRLITWDYPHESEPDGWIKEAGTSRRREDADPNKEYHRW